MPNVIFAILHTFVRIGGKDVFTFEAESGYSVRTLRRFFPCIERRGWCARCGGIWSITERGKIALAIEVGRRTKQRLGVRKFARQKCRDFELAA